MKKYLFLKFCLFLFGLCFSQQNNLSSLLISENLKINANSVIRNQNILITITSQKLMSITTQKTITILNSNGINNLDTNEYYNKSTVIKFIEATIYNAAGIEIKKFKKKDFIDQSVADGFSVYSDRRKLFLNYTPVDYPFTVVYESTIETSNTAFIPSWYPIDDFLESIEQSNIKITYSSSLGFKYLENNFEKIIPNKILGENYISYSVANIPAEKQEQMAPSFLKIVPNVLFGLEKFSLEGVEGNATTWKEFGNWIYSNLLAGTEELPQITKNKIIELTKNETDTLKKAKIVYQFVQDKTRYVSIQMGIGGWKPMKASEVDKLAYGDCKALSNYTRTLLKSIGIKSYYTIIYGNEKQRNIRKDFVSMQGNHAILAIPYNNELTFLECTSQVTPFGFQGNFTDNRDALIICENDSKIVRTNNWSDKSNSKIINAKCTIDENGNLSSTINIKFKGTQYDVSYLIERQDKDVIDNYFKQQFNWINNIKVAKIKFINNKENIEFTQNFELFADNYSKNNSGLMLFPINIFNRYDEVPQRSKFRKNSIEIERGFYDEDEVEINLPLNFKIDSKPETIEFNDKYGNFKIEIIQLTPTKILFKRKLLLFKGIYNNTEYEDYRKFIEQIAKADNSKILITKN